MVEPESRTTRSETVRVRRVPRYSVFLVLGAGVGLLVAAILTFSFRGTDAVSPSTGLIYTDGQVFGFLALICVVAGLAVFGLLALLLDRIAGRRAREFTAEHETVLDAPTGSAITTGDDPEPPATRLIE